MINYCSSLYNSSNAGLVLTGINIVFPIFYITTCPSRKQTLYHVTEISVQDNGTNRLTVWYFA